LPIVNYVSEPFNNQTLFIPIYCLIVAQLVKVPYHLAIHRRLNLRLLTTAGGMPSSHAALVTSLATAVGVREGWGSAAFAISVVLAMVVMYDAAGVRRAVSIQARILNQLLDELFAGQPMSEERLRELLGHTPVEVFVGALIGLVLTLWLAK
jgi:acid phosphatase family membrane protein YuiD